MTDRNEPYVVDETAGKKAICACGLSANRPYCDGTHARENTGITPRMVEIDADKQVAYCGCLKSGNLPYCDGTHSKG